MLYIHKLGREHSFVILLLKRGAERSHICCTYTFCNISATTIQILPIDVSILKSGQFWSRLHSLDFQMELFWMSCDMHKIGSVGQLKKWIERSHTCCTYAFCNISAINIQIPTIDMPIL
jgi:hypothetical protein